MSRWPRNIISIALIVVAVVSLGLAVQVWADHNGNDKAGTTPAPSASISASPSSSPAPTPATVSAVWHSDPTQSTVGSLSPAPQLVAIRTGAHTVDGYDRLALDFAQPTAPGYSAEYVSQVTRDGSGQAVSLAGSSFLQLVFTPAVAHDNSSRTAIGTEPVTVGYTKLKSYVVNGDFENQVSIALGLSGRGGYRISQERTNATIWTVYIDVR